jgi:hypothetical protein
MPEPHLRAADTDRAAVAHVLGEHMAAGRLTLAEYDERVTRAYAAKTYGELAELTTDLPSTRAVRRATSPAPAPRPAPATACGPGSRGSVADGWRAWVTTALIVIGVWLVTSFVSGEMHYFWPMWVIGPWGAVLLASTLATAGQRSRRNVTTPETRSGG